MSYLKERRAKFLIFIIVLSILAGLTGCNKNPFSVNLDASGKLPPVKKLVFGRANDSISLDPANAIDNESFKVTVNIFETLVKYSEEESGIEPCLATSWKVSEDGLTWLFYLRQGVKFHDGTVFNANAVEFNFHRWMNKNHPYHNGKFEYWHFIFGGFPGLVKSVTALSDYTIKIVLAKPYAPFLNTLAMPAFGIASPKAIRTYREEFYKHPVGTGPFVFKRWEENSHITLKANSNYWGKVPYIDELEFRVIPSSKERLELLEKGAVHIIDGLNPDDLTAIKDNPELRVYLRPSLNVGYLAMNTQKTPFDIREVRLAVNHAVNKDKLVQIAFNNLAKPAKTLIPPLLWGYNEAIQPYEYNPAKAKQLLAEAGYPRGFKTELWTMMQSRPYLPNPLLTAEFIKEELQKINIKVSICVFDWETFLEKIKNGEHQMALIGWIGDNRDPDNFLYTMFGSDNAQLGRAGNFSFYRNPEVNMLLLQARQTSYMSFRENLYRKVQEKIHHDAPVLPLVHTMPVLATRHTVRGFIPHITGVESFEYVNIYEHRD